MTNKELSDASNYPIPKKYVANSKEYIAPLENRRDYLRLDFNENTLGPSKKVLEYLNQISLKEIAIYPEYKGLKELLLKNLKLKNVEESEIGIFNGVDAAISAIFNAYGGENDFFLTTDPTFGYYIPCAEMQGMKIIKLPYLGDNYEFPLKDFKDNIIKYQPKIIFICNPNNPTGTLLSTDTIIQISEINKDSLLVIDEVYESFLGDSLLSKINFKKRNNIILLQSLSKKAGLAGLRIGFAFGNYKLVKNLSKVTGPYDVNSFAVKAAFAALEDQKYIDDYVKEVLKAREWIKNKFEEKKIISHFGSGNYFLVWSNIKADILENKLKEEGILIRNMSKKKYIEGAIRVSIGTLDQMKYFWEKYLEIEFGSSD
tara:strand:+ start:27604 stop:28719 length:1116 start_codon:yes stop_codon:yes gene_type:complete